MDRALLLAGVFLVARPYGLGEMQPVRFLLRCPPAIAEVSPARRNPATGAVELAHELEGLPLGLHRCTVTAIGEDGTSPPVDVQIDQYRTRTCVRGKNPDGWGRRVCVTRP